MRFDMHVHTSRHSPDSIMDPFAMLKQAKKVGLDGIVLTEHDFMWTEKELNELRKAAPDLVLLSGIEVTARGGDVLVYGVSNPFAFPRGMPWSDLCAEVHRQGGAAVIAHPYRWGQPFEDLMKRHKPAIDGLEMMSNNMDRDMCKRIAEYAERHPHLAQLGNSDAHELSVLGYCYTEFSVEVRSNADLVAAIKDGKARPCRRSKSQGERGA